MRKRDPRDPLRYAVNLGDLTAFAEPLGPVMLALGPFLTKETVRCENNLFDSAGVLLNESVDAEQLDCLLWLLRTKLGIPIFKLRIYEGSGKTWTRCPTPTAAQLQRIVDGKQGEAAEEGLLMLLWTIYRRPKDYPHGYVARRFELIGGQPFPTLEALWCPCAPEVEADGLEEVRRQVREWLYQAGRAPLRLDREPEDEPQIVETWIG